MLLKEKCFYPIKTKCSVTNELQNFALSHKDWYTETKNDKYSFLQCKVPEQIIEKDYVLKTFCSNSNKHCAIYLMPANVYYTMHIDTYRKCAINLALDNYDSITFFKTGIFRRNQIHFHELNYEKDTYYIFNTTVKHGVLNRNNDRYVLSIGFNDIEYQSLIDRVSLFQI
jgi:hypothetical protein